MADMPAKIWANQPSPKGCVISFTTPSRDYNEGYIRADLVEPLVIELRNARLQIQYLNERFGQTGSSNCTLNRIDAALQAHEAAQ